MRFSRNRFRSGVTAALLATFVGSTLSAQKPVPTRLTLERQVPVVVGAPVGASVHPGLRASTLIVLVDTAPEPPALFTKRDAILAGLFTAGTIVLMQYDDEIATEIEREREREGERDRRYLANAATNFNVINERSLFAGGVVLYGIGKLAGLETMTDIAFHLSEAVFISSAFNTVIRGTLGRSRPFITSGEDPFDYEFGKGFSDLAYRAFPSIHASAAYAGAAVVTSEVAERWPEAKWYVGTLSYAVAAMPGLARMYRNKHWASDVLMGAFVGTLTGVKVVRYHHSRPGDRLDRIFLGVSSDAGRPMLTGRVVF